MKPSKKRNGRGIPRSRAEPQIEQGGPMVLLCAPPRELLVAVDNRTSPPVSSTNQNPKLSKKEGTMAQAGATQRSSEQPDAIRPFHFNVSDADLTELRTRINNTRWPERETVADASQGVQLATMQNLARYWGQITTGESARQNCSPCRTSSPRLTGWTFISFTSVQNMKMRCRSSLRMDGPARSPNS